MTTILHLPLDETGTGCEGFVALLPEEEQERARRFHFDADRLRFAKCRVLLRQQLGALLEIPPSDIRFRFGEHGKPFLDGTTGIQFNISHTRGAALIAIGHGAEIGVDVECGRRLKHLDGVARRVFTERELDELFALPEGEKRALFLRLWTAKEAFLKAVGSGLSLDPATVEAYLPGEAAPLGRFECERVDHSTSLRCVSVPLPGKGLQAMLCAPQAECEFRIADGSS